MRIEGRILMSRGRALNLSIDENIKIKAKSYAKNHQTSVSHLVEDYFRQLLDVNEQSTYTPKSDNLRSLVGILGKENEDSVSVKDSYHMHLEEKYLND